MTPLLVVAVLVAGALGSVLRYLAGLAGARTSWPWPVLAVNAAASLVAGLAVHTDLRLVVVTGFAGGLSTFSTFSVETVQLVLARRYRTAVLSVLLNLVLGIALATLGWFLGLLLLG